MFAQCEFGSFDGSWEQLGGMGGVLIPGDVGFVVDIPA